MERQFPTYIINGTRFIVDVEKDEIRQKDQEMNVIRFSEMNYTGSGYSFQYDTVIRNLPIGLNNHHIKEVEIPMQVVLDPSAIAGKYGIPVEMLGRRTDYDLIVNQELVQQRLSGVLPVIDIAGHDFIVDYRLNELRPKDDFSTSIRLGELNYDYDEEKYRAFYQPSTHSIVNVDPKTITEIPEGLVMIEIPLECKLDPVAAAKEFGIDIKAMLIKHPPQQKLTVNVVPVEKTNLPKLVERNRASQKDRQNSNENTQKHSRRIS